MVVPDRLDITSDLFSGGSSAGNIVFEVPSAGAADGTLSVQPAMFSDKAFVAVR